MYKVIMNKTGPLAVAMGDEPDDEIETICAYAEEGTPVIIVAELVDLEDLGIKVEDVTVVNESALADDNYEAAEHEDNFYRPEDDA